TPTTTTVANGETKPAVNMNGATLTNISSNLPNTTSVGDKPTTNAPITAQEAQDLANKSGSNAATLGDVLNAGWNLQGNGVAKDFVKPYDTVNFVNGAGTTAEVTSNGQVSNVTYNVAVDDTTTEITYTDAKGNTLYKQADGTYNTARDGKGTTVKAGDVTGSRVSAKTSPLTNNADGTVNTPANPNSLATAGDVANVVNNSGFTLTTSASKGEVEGTSNYKVNPGKTVTVDAGKNIKVTQKDGVVSVATKDDVEFSSVKTNKIEAGPVTIDQNGIDAGGKKITNVARGTKGTDAVNLNQLKEVAGDIHNKINRNNKDLRAGIAGANAAAGLPQVYTPGRSMVAASVGAFKGQSALAVGYSRASDNGKLILKLQGNANSRGDVGGSVGMGYQW
ncbi:MAG: YadA-like family protein, partial [[Actinobacillus] rossii]|nr:YadA-like family protein [[Actinobacillus] rossii]MDY3123992.1 YadA-like family protein [[Actinobacillus] rossii]MDY5792376.1 YadA-like family protein [[Actinobacillus] rossii]